MRAPSILELSVEETLEPRVAFIQSAACVPDDSVGKLLLKSPSLLTCTQAQMQLRIDFLRRAGFDDAQMARAVVAFPQVCTCCCPTGRAFGASTEAQHVRNVITR